MKKILLSTFLAGVTANIYGMDLTADDSAVGKMLRHGAYTELDTGSFIGDARRLRDVRKFSQIKASKGDKVKNLFESTGEKYFAEGVQILRNQANYAEEWTIKRLGDSIYRFFDNNGLADFYGALSLKNIEVLDADFAQKSDNCLTIGKQGDITVLGAKDYQSGVNLFHDSRFFNVKIGTYKENQNRIHAICDFDKDTNLSQISLYNTLEAYDGIFAHESGHSYQHFAYPELYQQRYDVIQKTGHENDVLYLSSEIIAWMFEFRYLIEKETLNKGDIVSLGTVIPKMLYDATPTISYYFTNYAMSMAGQMDKNLKELADLAIADIRNHIVPYFADIPEKRCFSGVSGALEGQYGIDKNLVVKFNAEKNKCVLRKLLAKMGHNSDTIMNQTSSIVKKEHREFIDAVLALETR